MSLKSPIVTITGNMPGPKMLPKATPAAPSHPVTAPRAQRVALPAARAAGFAHVYTDSKGRSQEMNSGPLPFRSLVFSFRIPNANFNDRGRYMK